MFILLHFYHVQGAFRISVGSSFVSFSSSSLLYSVYVSLTLIAYHILNKYITSYCYISVNIPIPILLIFNYKRSSFLIKRHFSCKSVRQNGKNHVLYNSTSVSIIVPTVKMSKLWLREIFKKRMPKIYRVSQQQRWDPKHLSDYKALLVAIRSFWCRISKNCFQMSPTIKQVSECLFITF